MNRISKPVWVVNGRPIENATTAAVNNLLIKNGEAPLTKLDEKAGRAATMAYGILKKHNVGGDDGLLHIRFDRMASHDITYVGILQTAKQGGLTKFPMPYALTNCHNSLCAVGGTINEDDHLFGLSAAKRYGGIFVPPHMAVIHQYVREELSLGGGMILGSDSHTRYGALGTMGVGEGGPELVKQLLRRTWDIKQPKVIAVILTGKPAPYVGPQDVALSIIGEVFKDGFVKNCVMEFVGDGIDGLSVDYRNGIDVMTTETACLSSIWRTDLKVRDWYAMHGRLKDYAPVTPGAAALYDGALLVDLSEIKPVVALPCHPSNVMPISEVNENLDSVLKEIAEAAASMGKAEFDPSALVRDGRLFIQQSVVAGCAGGTYENIEIISRMQCSKEPETDTSLSVYPASMPVFDRLIQTGAVSRLTAMGATVRSAFCGPCFGAGDVPSSGTLSMRHTTRNFPNREGSKPGEGQVSAVLLADARSIMATAMNGGRLTSAEEVNVPTKTEAYIYNPKLYAKRVYHGEDKPQPETQLVYGPNIKDYPDIYPMSDNLLLKFCAVIDDPVTTTDELIPSGETSSYRSNPEKLATFALSRKVPAYVGLASAVRVKENNRRSGAIPEELKMLAEALGEEDVAAFAASTAMGSLIYAHKPGDGSAREQAASCQRVLGGYANVAREYATKRYRSNLINWGLLPFILPENVPFDFKESEWLYIPGIKAVLEAGGECIEAIRVLDGSRIPLALPGLTAEDRRILLAGCLMNFYASENVK